MTVTPITTRSSLTSPVQVNTSPAPALGMQFSSAAATGLAIAKSMEVIKNSKLIELAVTDVCGMVLPRTSIELKQRGSDTAREVFLREIAGTLTLVFLSGWVGMGINNFMQNASTNPRMLSYRAWIDAGMLDHFSKTVKQILPKVKTVDELKSGFVDTILKQMQSTDGIYEVKQFSDLFPHRGRLVPEVREKILNTIVQGKQLLLGKSGNVETQVNQLISSPEYHRADLANTALKTTEQFLEERGVQSTKALSDRQAKRLAELIRENQDALRQKSRTINRNLFTKGIHWSEKPLIEHLATLAVTEGDLSERIILRSPETKQVFSCVGARPVKEVLEKVSHFMQEFLNRATTVNGVPQKGELNSSMRNNIIERLFENKGENWLTRNLITYRKDGLVTYALKQKRWLLSLPLGFTILVGGCFVLLNNWITREKYRGQRFFPGEVQQDDLKKLQLAQSLNPHGDLNA